jgi:hypothetical protein
MQRAVEKYYSVSETGWLLSFSPSWVRQKISENAFPGTFKSDADFRVPASAINSFIDAHKLRFPDADGLGISARSETEARRKISGSKL